MREPTWGSGGGPRVRAGARNQQWSACGSRRRGAAAIGAGTIGRREGQALGSGGGGLPEGRKEDDKWA